MMLSFPGYTVYTICTAVILPVYAIYIYYALQYAQYTLHWVSFAFTSFNFGNTKPIHPSFLTESLRTYKRIYSVFDLKVEINAGLCGCCKSYYKLYYTIV